jgi:hypothetical protein
MAHPRSLLVTPRALVQRINRALGPEEAVRRSRTDRMEQDVGEYYVLNYSINAVTNVHVDLEELGRELGCLKPFETLVDE